MGYRSQKDGGLLGKRMLTNVCFRVPGYEKTLYHKGQGKTAISSYRGFG